MDQVNASDLDCLKAEHVYSLLTDRYRISRNIRVEWFLHNLNQSFSASPKKSLADFKNEIDIISFITSDQNEEQQQPKQLDYSRFSINCDTKFTFFSRKYCFVFVLDMSTSVATVDIQHSTILTDELYGSLSKCLSNLVKPFYVPGSEFLFAPEIYITIVAYLPFYSLDVNNVIVHGCKLDLGSIERLLSQVREKIFQYIHLLSLNIKSEHFRDVFGHRSPGKIVIPANLSLINMIRFGLLSLNLLPENSHQGIVIVTDGNTSFSDAHTLESALAQLRLNMISCSFIHIGSPPHPDSALGYVPYIDFMNFIAQATFGAYLSISSDYDCDFDTNQFNIFHRALFVYSFNHGSCSFSKCLSKNKSKIWTIDNPYFYSDLDDERIRGEKKDQQPLRRKQLESQINAGFAQILSYRLREGFTIKKVNFLQTENIIELALILPWRYNVNIEYHISAYFQPNGNLSDEEDFNFTSYEVIVESNYSFLHDASCPKKIFKSPLRATTIKQFCAALKHLSDSDNLGLHFHHFAKNEMYRSIPESLKKGVSLYYLPPSSNVPVVSVQNEAHLKFAQYWKPICMLDVNMCQKSSLHTHQINVLLKHDHPLPEFLYQPNSFGRYETIQCKQTMSALNVVLKEWSSFVLLENHSYIKLIKEKENKSCSFYLIRIIAQPPCLVLHLAFIGGTSGSLRNQIVNELSQKLKQWKLPQRNLSSSLMQKTANTSNHAKNDPTATNDDESYSNDLSNDDDTTDTEEDTESDESQTSKENDTDSPTENNNPGNTNTNVFITISSHNKRNSSSNSANCFVILNRPIERMLIRYDKIPKDFNSCYKYEEDWRNKNSLTSYATLNMFQTLVRFLHHQRSIWCTHDSSYSLGSSKLNISSLSKILSTITMKRIKEGFTIAYNECGVVNLVKELMMKDDQTNNDEESKMFPCLVQYIIFPSNVLARDTANDSALNDHWEEDEDDQVDASQHFTNNNKNLFAENGCHYRHDGGRHLIVTECWIEPQNGKTSMLVNNNTNQNDDPQQSFDYDQISASFYQRDLELVSVLLTYEYLVSYDPKHDVYDRQWRRKSPVDYKNRANPEEIKKSSSAIESNLNLQSSRCERFKHIPFRFDLLNILDKSQQALIKFSTLNQMFDFNDSDAEEFTKSPSWNNCPNIMLYSEFVHKLCQFHDEIRFDHAQTISFIRKTNERLARHYSFEKEPLFTNVEELEQDSSIVFRCFSKKFSDDCIILTLLPSTYQVVRKLTFVDYSGQKINRNLIGKLMDRGPNVCYGSIIFPIIVHKLTFNSLTNILLNIHNPVEQLCPNWDLLFDYSDGSENFYSDQNEIIQTMDAQLEEIALENFTKSIETLFRNSFTDSIYKSLRYGFHADDQDVELVLEKICNKKFGYVDITDFLVYTCKHMRPVIDSYFSKYPSNSIFDLLSFIADYVDNNEDGQQQQRDILSLTLPKQSSCCNNNSRLKANFVNLIQSHFSAIPTPSDSYYYYDYENIQTKRYFTFRDSKMDAQKNLVGFYEKIDNNEMDLTMFYEKIKNLSRLLDQDNIKMERSPEEEVLVEEETATGNEPPEPLTEKGVDMNELQTLIMTKPFFVGFFYSLTLKNDTQARKISSIPTCLLEIIAAEQETINLENFRVFLNIEIITQNIEPYKISSNDSNASHGAAAADVQVISDDSTVFLEKLLDPFQVYKYREFFNHIQWMIRDEIVANSHDLFQICPQTLEMVVDHIKATGKSKTSFTDKVELKFVFPMDEDFPYLEEFQVELRQLRFSNFKLMEMGEYLYVVQDPDSDAPTLDFHSIEELSITEYTVEESEGHYSPNFWLILRLELDESKTNFVELYFHIRQKIYVFGSEILNQLKKCLELLCKKYNQKFLLARLHETRICDDLLIAKDDPDPFIKNTVRSTSNLTPISNFWEANSINSNFDLDYESFDNISSKISRANFTSGAFQCDIVWDKHFPLHRRLYSNNSKEGFNTIRSVLNSFLVSNRNNLYFYKEKSGAVFYMRIYEIECSNDSFGEHFQQSCQTDPMDFELYQLNFDNIIVPIINANNSNNQDDDSKCDSDNDSVNSLNVNRSHMNVPQECILMNVHGIEEPSNEIKVDMVQALQKKLDEAVLDILIVMLARNPHSKLTNQDVSFIQGHNSWLKNFQFVINECYYPYIQNIKGYIRQNLSTFLYNPKYAERNPESHFKLFKNNEFHCVKDEDVFLYHCTQESGKDTKGIACIIFSIVSQEKLFDMTPSTFNVNQTDINDFVNGYFDYIVSVSNTLSRENLNIKFCINFQVWHAGKIDLKYLSQKFRTAIVHSLWEFNLEFKIFKLCTYEDGFNCNSISEPSTPKKILDKRERRTGLANVGLKPSLLQIDDSKFFNKDYDKYGQASSSTFIETVGQEDYFDFGQINLYHKHEAAGNSSDQYTGINVREIRNQELICLSHFLKVAIKPWLDYGQQSSVPSIDRFEFPVVMKRSIFTIMKEFKEFIGKFSGDMKMHFLLSSGQQYYEFDCNSEFAFNNDDNSYMILLRHENLWKAKFLHQSEHSFSNNFIGKCDVNKFKFVPCFYNPNVKSIHDSNLALNTGNEIRFMEPEIIKCLSPRQKFLLLFIEDGKLKLYLYNWTNSMNMNIVGWFSHMILWHNARSLLLHNLILQKSGLFHNNLFKRHTLEDLMTMSNIPYLAKNKSISSTIFLNVDLLLKYDSPYRASGEIKDQPTPSASKMDFIFETKNYEYVYSDFVRTENNRNLFECFHGQFNSNYNVYIKDLKELSKVWQLHGTKLNYPTKDKIIQHVKSYGRLSHYCLTPFLFSHKWRFAISLIRDHSLPMQAQRTRHMSGGNILKQSNNEHEFMISKQRSRRKSGPPNMLEHSLMIGNQRSASDETLDLAVCPHYIQEYVQYLQSLGFSSIKSQKVVSLKKNFDFERRYENHYGQANYGKYKISSSGAQPILVGGNRKLSQHGQKNEYEKFYLIKTVMNGFYLFEIGFSEPFVYSYLYSFDSKRFTSWTKNNSNTNVINFLDELDSIMVRMHLHSFTYDYHLRVIHSYISGRQMFQRGYHLISFLDDFIRYYQKAPNYSRNHVYSDYLIYESEKIIADQLYNYIIKHNQNYGINVFPISSTFSLDQMSGMNEEYVLILLSSNKVLYIDENNIQQEDNFDVTLLVAYQKLNNARILRPKELCLKFYLLLTSQRELFPKLYSLRDKGLFRTIRMLSNPNVNSISNFPENNGEDDQLISNKSIMHRNSYEENPNSIMDRSHQMGISDEKINYLGYFNAHEIVMLKILEQKVNEARQNLENIIKAAEIDCRRDHIWESLVGNEIQITMDDLNELLSLVKSIRLEEYDETLVQFNSFNLNWYRSLAQKLELKFEYMSKKFFKNGSLKMALFKSDCKDCFIMFHLKNSPPCLVEFRIVFKKPSSAKIDQAFLRKCNPRYHELVEEFVNTLTAHMWTAMLSHM